jgi:hypothetical protein
MSEETEVMEPEVAENELPPHDVRDMIQYAMDNEFSKANDIFSDVMTIKLNDLLDQEQIRVADQMYNGVEDDEIDPDEEQLELDLEAESELESEDEVDEEPDEVEEDEDDFDSEDDEN